MAAEVVKESVAKVVVKAAVVVKEVVAGSGAEAAGGSAEAATAVGMSVDQAACSE